VPLLLLLVLAPLLLNLQHGWLAAIGCNNLYIDVYWKPATSDTTIYFHSNHPLEHKLAAYCFLLYGLQTLPLSEPQKEMKWTVHGFPPQMIYYLHRTGYVN
jgi:hypothetical protein